MIMEMIKNDLKEFPVPDELKELMLDYKVGIACRDKAITSWFTAKRAIKYGKNAEKARLKFWTMLDVLYPEISEKKLTVKYIYQNQMVKEIK